MPAAGTLSSIALVSGEVIKAFAEEVGLDVRAERQLTRIADRDTACEELMQHARSPDVKNVSAYVTKAVKSEIAKGPENRSEVPDTHGAEPELHYEPGMQLEDPQITMSAEDVKHFTGQAVIADAQNDAHEGFAEHGQDEAPVPWGGDDADADNVPAHEDDGDAQQGCDQDYAECGDYEEDCDEWCAEEAWWAEEAQGDWTEEDWAEWQ